MYHVINRGNYRRDLFESAGAAKAFEETLEEACEVHGWKLHAHVVMKNHFHLAVETPQANLVAGMHWLQSTFSSRFNRFRQERGHLFQGRYQALLIEDAAALARVMDYIHLNPVRAGIVAVEHLADFRWSSLRRFVRGPRGTSWIAEDITTQRGFADSPTGWRAYVDYLADLCGNETLQNELEFGDMCRGWAIGTHSWRKAMAKEHAQRALDPGLERKELLEIKHVRFNEYLEQELSTLGVTAEALRTDRKTAPWKVDLALSLRQKGVPYRWLAEHLHMGSPDSLRGFVTQRKRLLLDR
jgi:putative transposase